MYRTRSLFLAAFCLLVGGTRPAAAYTVDKCVVTVTAADVDRWGRPHSLFIDSRAKLDALAARVAGCSATGDSGGGWRIVGGGLWIYGTDDVADLEPLKDLRAIEGFSLGDSEDPDEKFDALRYDSSSGYSLEISNNKALTTIKGLRGLRGALPSTLSIKSNDALESLSGLEGVTGIEGFIANGKYRKSLIIDGNGSSLTLETKFLDLRNCADITALNMTVRPAREPSTHVDVLAADPAAGTLTVQVKPGFPEHFPSYFRVEQRGNTIMRVVDEVNRNLIRAMYHSNQSNCQNSYRIYVCWCTAGQFPVRSFFDHLVCRAPIRYI